MSQSSIADGEEFIDLRKLLLLVWERKWWVTACILFSSVAFVSYAFYVPQIYRASALLSPASVDRGGLGGAMSSAIGQLGGLASLAGINVGAADSETQESIAVLQSREFTERFIVDHNLMPKLFPKDWDEAAGRWKEGIRNPPTTAKGNKLFGQEIRAVTQDKKTGLVTVRIEWRDRLEAADWANDLVRRLNVEMRSRAVTKAEASVGFLQNELSTTADVGTREAINRLIESQVKQRMIVNVTEEYAFRFVDEALPPDDDDYVWPKRAMLVGLGPLVGAVLGVLLVLIRPLFMAQPGKAAT